MFRTSRIRFFIVFFFFCSRESASVSDPGPRLKVLPPNFHTSFVLNSAAAGAFKVSYFVTMAVDTDGNKIAMEMHHPMKNIGHIWLLINFSSNDIFVAYLDRGECQTKPLGLGTQAWLQLCYWNPLLYLYGLGMKTSGNVATPAEILQFLNSKTPLYQSGHDVNGILSDTWRVNFKLSDVNPNIETPTDIQMDFMWSINNTWHTGWGWDKFEHAFPLANNIVVQDTNAKTSFNIHMVYSYISPKRGPHSFFQVPPKHYCPPSYGLVPLPSWSKQYSFQAEVAIPANDTFFQSNEKEGYIMYSFEYFDTERKLSASVYQHPILEKGDNGESVYEIHDHVFHTAYRFTKTSNCTIVPMVLDVAVLQDAWDLARIQLNYPVQFFDTSRHYSHVGTRSCRGADCNVYTIQRWDWPPGASARANISSVWEWYLGTEQWRADTTFDTERQVPIKLDLTITAEDCTNSGLPCRFIFGTLTYNLFNYHSDEEPMSAMFNIQPCLAFKGVQKQTFKLNLDKACVPDFARTMQSNSSWLENQVHVTLFSLGQLRTLLRLSISSMNSAEPSVIFDLYDTWKILNYSTFHNIKLQPSATAITLWQQAIASKTLKIFLLRQSAMSGCTVESMEQYSWPSSQAPPVADKSGYSAGAMGGLAAGMILLGMLFGAVALYLLALKFRTKGAEGFQFQMFNAIEKD